MKTLITPLGNSIGSVLTAIHHTQPEAVVLIASPETWQQHQHAFPPHLPITVHTLSDPYKGFGEGRRLAQHLAQQHQADDVIVNISGGTTVLQDTARVVAFLLQATEIATFENKNAGKDGIGEIVMLDKVFATAKGEK